MAVIVDSEAPLAADSTGDALSLYKQSFTGALFVERIVNSAAKVVDFNNCSL